MEILIIVNIITSLSVLLGGICMKKYADSPADYSIGFRTRLAMSSPEAWSFANKKCGRLWIIIGIIGFIAAIDGTFTPFGYTGYAELGVLILLILALIFSVISTEMHLKHDFK